MTRTLLVLCIVLSGAGCNRSSVIFSIAGNPVATAQMKQKTISTRVDSAGVQIAKSTELATIRELQRAGFHYVPKNGAITLDIDSDFGGRSIAGSKNWVNYWAASPRGPNKLT